MIKELESLSKKRKCDDHQTDENLEKSKIMKKSVFDTDIRHETTRLPLEWQRCLDIKSGHIYFYNMRTQKRMSTDPRSCPDTSVTSPAAPMSLELELNLPCGSQGRHNQAKQDLIKQKPSSLSTRKEVSEGLSRSPSWLTTEGEQQEMVTAVCKKCYMLVMMCKASPACPNCKFVHPPDPNPSMFNQGLSLLC